MRRGNKSFLDDWADQNIYNQPELVQPIRRAPFEYGDNSGLNIDDLMSEADTSLKYPPIIGQNFTYGRANTQGGSPPNPVNSKTGGLKGWFTGLGNNSGWNLTGNSKFGLGNTNGKAGLTIGGKNLGGLATAGAGIYQGIRGIQNLNDLSETKSTRDDLLNQIRASAAGNPMLSSYLTDDEIATLNKVKRGNFDNDATNKDMFGGILKGAGTGALTGLAGGLPGIIVGALGGAINGGVTSQNEAQQRENATLEGLYNSLANANAQYKRMRIPNYTGLGLQSRYTNQWI